MSSIPSIWCDTAAANGTAAFEEVVVPLIGDAYRTARRFARQHDEACDLTQEALLRALRGFKHFRPGTNARAWLRTIVHSVFLTHYRQRQREPAMIGHDIERVTEKAWRETFSEPAASESTDCAGISDPRLRRALDRLPPASRDAVRLVDIDELTYEEAARALRCPLNTLKSRLFRGRRRLLEMLRNENPPA
jgi:RNA polymerase sigma-70 factor (ECF subfamily)